MRLLVYGSKEFALTVSDLVQHCGHEVVGMVDDFNSDFKILGTFESIRHSHPPTEFGFAIAVGYKNLQARQSVSDKVREAGYDIPPLVHPRAYVADSACIGAGSMIMAGSIVDIRAVIGELTVVWPGACINHDTVIANNCFISPGATICGYVNIGHSCFIGAGAVIVDHCSVPEMSFIKMLSCYTGFCK